MSRMDSIDITRDITDEDTEDEQELEKSEELKKDDANQPEPEQLLKRKRVRTDKPFSEDMLASENGLLRIYTEFPKIYKCGGRGAEARSLKKLTGMYKEWAFQLHRGVAFSDMLSRCETFGSKGKIRSTVSQLREQERERYMGLLAKDLPPVPVRAEPLGVAPAATHNQAERDEEERAQPATAAPSSSSSSSNSPVNRPSAVIEGANSGAAFASSAVTTARVQEEEEFQEIEEAMVVSPIAGHSGPKKRRAVDMFGDEVSFEDTPDLAVAAASAAAGVHAPGLDISFTDGAETE